MRSRHFFSKYSAPDDQDQSVLIPGAVLFRDTDRLIEPVNLCLHHTPGGHNKNALILYATDDHNGAYDINPASSPNTKSLFARLSLSYNVKFRRAITVEEFKKYIKKNGQTDYLIIGGHGFPSGVTFSKGEQLDLNTDLTSLNQYFALGAHVYIDSGRIGENVKNTLNITEYIAKSFPNTTVSTPKIKHIDKYVAGLSSDGLVRLMNNNENISYVIKADQLDAS